MGFSILMIPVASSTISMLSYLIEALKDHKAVTVDIAAARDFVTDAWAAVKTHTATVDTPKGRPTKQKVHFTKPC
eukprot:g27480.t1